MRNAFVFYLKKQDIFFVQNSFVDFDLISLIHSYVYVQIQNSVYKTPVIIWPCHILYSEN